ncbi:MAG: ATP-binding cassette domain-containing protein [Patescibacteria group bacterium]|jgi:sodium transport system ATP-binding protein
MLKVQNLTKKFNSFTAVDDVSFQANGGEIFGLLGPNGAGKTTTISVIATVLSPTSGTAEVVGFDILKNSEAVRQNLGLLTSEIGLYDRFTARENLRYFGKLYGMEGEKLEDRINRLIEILDMKMFADRRAGKFSTGMKQKVAIARSIIHDPKVIIFDEPTAGLDVLAAQTVINYMKTARAEGKLVVLSTHDMTHAQELCDRVAIMHRGKIVALDKQEVIFQKTQTQNLEEAFLKIIGEDEISAANQEREAQFLKKSDKPKRRFGL